MVYFIFLLISFLASVVGCICGIGGGIIIKPVLDAFHIYSVSVISFLSGCVVLSMSAYSVLRSVSGGEKSIEKGTGTLLAVGAALGGIAGKMIFNSIKQSFADPNRVGAVQAGVLLLLTAATILYTLKKDSIKTHRLTSPVMCILIGLGLGMMSSFLGIGGGPINLVALSFFFSMRTKTAAQNSIYIILISQISNLIYTFLCHDVPEFPVPLFIAMVACGIFGGMLGRKINKKLLESDVNRLFIALLSVICLICVYNIWIFVR